MTETSRMPRDEMKTDVAGFSRVDLKDMLKWWRILLLLPCVRWQKKNPPAMCFESSSHDNVNGYTSFDIQELSVMNIFCIKCGLASLPAVMGRVYGETDWDAEEFQSPFSCLVGHSRVCRGPELVWWPAAVAGRRIWNKFPASLRLTNYLKRTI